MIARNLRAGKFAEGIINYAFEGKEADHQDKQAELLRHSDDLLVPFNAQDIEGIQELTRQFNARTSAYLQQNPENKNALIGHQILSFTQEDEAKLKKVGIDNVLDEYIKLAQLEKTHYVAIAHNDTSNYHVHLIYHKVQNDGRKEAEWKLNNKTLERGVALALKNRLTLVKDQKKVALTKGVLEIRSKDADIQQLRQESKELAQAKNLHHLTKLLETRQLVAEQLKDDRLKIDKKVYRPEDLNAVFYFNRNENNSGSMSVKANESGLLKQESKSQAESTKKAKANGSIQDGSAVEKELSGDKEQPFRLVIIQSNDKEPLPLPRKRKGKHYLLKNKTVKSISQSNEQKR